MKALALTVIALNVALLSGCALPVPRVTADNIEWLEFSQTGSDWNFDISEDSAEVEQFRQLLLDFDVDPAAYVPLDTGCALGVTTLLQVFYRPAPFLPGGQSQMTIVDCRQDSDSFEARATGIFTGWRLANDPDASPAPNSDIVALVVDIDGVPGQPDGELRQTDPDQIARFVELADTEGIRLSDAGWVEMEVEGVDPCEEFGVYNVSAEYSTTNVVAGPIPLQPCGTTDWFASDAAALFDAWADD